MDVEAGDSIPFILSVFTVILSIVPTIELPHTNDSPTTNLALFQATIDAIHNNSKQHSFAYNLLHTSTKSNNFTPDENIPIPIYTNIVNAIDLYNNESISANSSNYNITKSNLSKSYLDSNCIHPPKKNMTICNEIWFTNRLLNLEQYYHPNDMKEDNFNCTKIVNDTKKCSYEELQSLKKINSQMNKGFINYFYNERNLTSLEKPVESFVSGLNNFFISVLLAGPGIFLTYIKMTTKNRKNESEG
jgi:hypothetical protein